MSINWINGGVTAPRGYLASGAAAGIKPKSKKLDCALIYSELEALAAGVFTTNVLKGAHVPWCMELVKRGRARAIFVNSGNANAATGEQGRADVREIAALAGAKLDCATEYVAVCSTGVIGVPLPMQRVREGVKLTCERLSHGGSIEAAKAIMTTDTAPKETAVELKLSTGTVRIGSIVKGSGMCAPNMATMLAFITSDATMEQPLLQAMLSRAVNVSFNRICVDNDMSDNDTVLALINCAAGLPGIQEGSTDAVLFEEALTELCIESAKKLVRDGEGATKFVELQVEGAPGEAEALTVCKAIAHSHLCKTAWYGQDANWGRIACAAGYSGVPFEESDLCIWLNDLQLLENGEPTPYKEKDAAKIMKQPEFTIRVKVGSGPGAAVFWTSDLSKDYVSINADYRT